MVRNTAKHRLPLKIDIDVSQYNVDAVNVQTLRIYERRETLIVLYHSQSNGQAGRFVQAFKQFFMVAGSNSIKQSSAPTIFI